MKATDFMNQKEQPQGVLPELAPYILKDIENIVKGKRNTIRDAEGMEGEVKKWCPSYFRTEDVNAIRRAIVTDMERYPPEPESIGRDENLYYEDGRPRYGEVLRDFYRMNSRIKELLDMGTGPEPENSAPNQWGPEEVGDFLRILIKDGGLDPLEANGIINGFPCGCRTWDAYPKGYKEETLTELHREGERQHSGEVSISRLMGMGTVYTLLAREFLRTWPSVVMEGASALRLYGGGIYRKPYTKTEVEKRFHSLSEKYGLEFTPDNLKNSEKMLMTLCPIADPAGSEAYTKICLKNGVLDVMTREFSAHSPEKVFFHSLPVAYDPGAGAEPEKFTEFINSTFVGREEEINILQEMMGYCLLRDMPFHAFFFLVGEGGAGKGTILRIISALLGKDNVAAFSLRDITSKKNEQALATLHGKYANVGGDVSAEAIKDFSTMREATGGDWIRARNLYEGYFTFKNFSKFIFAMEKPPIINDMTRGFTRRLKFINFVNPVGLKEIREDIEKEMIEAGELPQILNWSLGGLERLMKNKGFTETKGEAENAAEYAMKADPVKYFVRDRIDEDESGQYLPLFRVMEAYTKYRKVHNLPLQTDAEIKKGIMSECEDLGIPCKFGRPRKGQLKEGDTKKAKCIGLSRFPAFRGIMIVDETGKGNSQDGIEDREEHDREEKKRRMMKDLSNYLKTAQRDNGGIEDPEETAAGFLVKYPGYKPVADLEEITGYTRKVKEGFTLPN